jgi:hypothetical protein
MTHAYSFNDRTLSIVDLGYSYSMKSDIHSVTLTLDDSTSENPSTFQAAFHGKDLQQVHDGDPQKTIDKIEVLGMKVAARVVSAILPELSGRYTFGKRFTYHPVMMTVDNTHVYYSGMKDENNGMPRDFNTLMNSIDQCFKAVQGHCLQRPTEVLKTADVLPILKKRA